MIPIAGRLPDGAASLADATVVSSDRARIRAAAAELLSDAVWRDRLALAETLPARARLASAGLADAVTDAIGAGTPVALHVMRSYLAPLGVAVSSHCGRAGPRSISMRTTPHSQRFWATRRRRRRTIAC